jgi:hypothetical protein
MQARALNGCACAASQVLKRNDCSEACGGPMPSVALSFEGLGHTYYSGRWVFRSYRAVVPEERVFALPGPNSRGKTTLLDTAWRTHLVVSRTFERPTADGDLRPRAGTGTHPNPPRRARRTKRRSSSSTPTPARLNATTPASSGRSSERDQRTPMHQPTFAKTARRWRGLVSCPACAGSTMRAALRRVPGTDDAEPSS